MNEIDPNSSNGSLSTENHQDETHSASRSPLLSSLLTATKHENLLLSNGQQEKPSRNAHSTLMMPSSAGASAIVANPQYDESNYLKKATVNQATTDNGKELDLSPINSHKRSGNLNELLQRNNNNNKVATQSEIPSKSILENCLLKPSPIKGQHRLESQYYHNKMDESSTSSSVLKFAHQPDENRKVEPLKINLNREPIKTVIKLPQQHHLHESPTKITIKPPQPPDRNSILPPPSISISPTLSSSSSLSSESSYENYSETLHHHHQPQRPAMQVVPKLHLRNLLDTSFNHEQSELHIVPKLTITGLNSPQTVAASITNEPARDHNVNSIIDSPAIPKLTIKKDNNASEGFYHLNHEVNAIPKLHIKTNHHHHHNAQKDGVKLTIKPIVEQSLPPVPKLTIKTTDNDKNTMTVVNSSSTSSFEMDHEQPPPSLQQAAIPKLTIKANQQSATPKLTIKQSSEESIPKLTLKAVNHSATSPTFEKIVPKLVVKLPKDTQPDVEEEKGSSSCSSTPSPPPIVSKLTIKPIPFPEKEVPNKNCIDATSQSEVKFSINRLIGSTPAAESVSDETDNVAYSKPLEINTNVIKSADSGQDSPRIILKINKTNNESITTEIIQPESVHNKSSNIVNNKRSHPSEMNDNDQEDLSKKPKLTEDEQEVIIINDDSTSNDTANQKNHHSAKLQEAKNANSESISVIKAEETKTNSVSARSLRQTRRNHEGAQKSQPIVVQENSQSAKEDSQPSETDPLALSNDATTNSNSVEELVTPIKRGRGRPKKIQIDKPPPPPPSAVVEETESRDPLELSVGENSSQQEGFESVTVTPSTEVKKTRGRGRGRGRLKRTVEYMKNGKPVQVTLEKHDDDDSPSFSLYNRSLRGGFHMGRRPRGGKSARGKIAKSSPFITPERSKDGNFMSPNSDYKDNNRRKLFNTPSLFEEDTRMSIGQDSQTPFRSVEMHSNEESQSSILSSTSNTIEGTAKKRQKKMEVCEPEGRTEFSIDMLTEYEWPQTESGRNRETFMIQEQIAEYLGVKSFKRKYPDLMRRPVEMEERNYLFENGLASEKMCDLGLTAIFASEVLDIMCNDYPEKYEEYKRYQREKIFRNARLRLETAVVDRSQMQKDKAISSTSEWNSRFNKDRRENRRCCMDLQNFLIQKPTPIREYNYTPSSTHRSPYPVALVPGQFSEYYQKYTPEQLACYPINTILVDYNKLEEYMAQNSNPYESSADSDSSDDSNIGSSSESDSSDSESSSDDDYEDPLCKVCSETPYKNRYSQPEKFIKCFTCKNEAHPSCIEMSQRMYVRTQAYKWQCSNCKTCCKCLKQRDNKMLYCVQCDRGFHIYCLGLRNVPEGQYHCVNCTVCSECGAKSPEGHFNPALSQQQRQDLAMIAQWNHEFVVNPLTQIREHRASLCLPCFRKINPKNNDE